jgi:hypothetical protein
MSASPATEAAPPGQPPEFTAAVAQLRGAAVRPEIELGELPAPQRLAPWSHALSATVHDPVSDAEIGSGRLVLLHDPSGVEAWHGTYRYVVFASCDVEGEIARDPLLPDVAWSWLLESLVAADAPYTALGGTVTATSSVRFGEIADTARTDDVEVRASWTAPDGDAGPHLAAFVGLLTVAAGLPPEGVSTLVRRKNDGKSSS